MNDLSLIFLDFLLLSDFDFYNNWVFELVNRLVWGKNNLKTSKASN